MEPVPATTLKALVAFFSKPTVKQEEGTAAHVVCQRQANQRNPTHPRHYLPGELLMLEDPRTRERFEPPRRIVLLGKGTWRLTYYMGDFVLQPPLPRFVPLLPGRDASVWASMTPSPTPLRTSTAWYSRE